LYLCVCSRQLIGCGNHDFRAPGGSESILSGAGLNAINARI
jgi:hypothetical protein